VLVLSKTFVPPSFEVPAAMFILAACPAVEVANLVTVNVTAVLAA